MPKNKPFQSGMIDKEDFGADLNAVLKFEETQIKSVLNWFLQREEPLSETKTEEIQMLSSKLELSGEEVDRFLRMSRFWMAELIEYKIN